MPPAPLPPGTRIRHYHIQSLLGRGGMGEVYLAADYQLGRSVVIKLLPREYAHDRRLWRRLEQEARAASALNHPNIVSIFDVGRSAAGPFIVMEFVEGQLLRDLIGPALPIATLIALATQLAQALKAAHAAGIVHRDLKPENVMVRPDGYVKVLDFGVARVLSEERGTADADTMMLTSPGALIGTPSYMSPEVARGSTVTTASDIFALGIVLYEVATGKRPFDGGSWAAVIDAILTKEADPPRTIRPELPYHLDELFVRMLDKRPELRPTAADVEAVVSKQPGVSGVSGSDSRRELETADGQHAHLVGRDSDRGVLEQAFRTASHGHGSIVCVAGEPGIGKSTLVDDVLRGLVHESRCLVGRGRCSERLAGADAYLPWLEILDDLLRGSSGSMVAGVMARVAPSWHAQLVSGTTAASVGSADRVKWELRSLITELSRTHTLVLGFDDLQWADLSTIDLLAYIGTTIASLCLQIFVTYRPTDLLLAKHPFVGVRQDLQARGCCRELVLEFLTNADVERYLAIEYPEHRFPRGLADAIHERTEGSPLFMVDVIRDLRNRGVIAQSNGVWELAESLAHVERGLPESARAMIERKMGQLTDEDRSILTVASVQGVEFDSAVVARALGIDAETVEERLEPIERIHGFVRIVATAQFPVGTPRLRYRFVHVLYQHAFAGSLRPTRSAQLSGDVARALLAYYGDQKQLIATELASLFDAAGDLQQAAGCYLLGAHNAARLCASRETIALAERGLRLVEHLPESPSRDLVELDLQLARGLALSANAGWGASALEPVLVRSRALCERIGQPERLFAASVSLWMYHELRGELAVARLIADESMTVARGLGDEALEMLAHEMVAETCWFRGEFESSRDRYAQCFTRYRRSHHPRFVELYGFDAGVGAMMCAAHALWALGDLDQASARLSEGIQLARELGHANTLAFALCHQALHRCLRGEAATARQPADESLALALEHGFASWEAYARVLRARASAHANGHSEAIADMRDGIARFRATGCEAEAPFFTALVAEACLEAGCSEVAIPLVDAQLATVSRLGLACHEAELLRLRGELAAAREQNADRWFDAACALAVRQGARLLELRATTSLVRWQRARDRVEDATRQRLAALAGSFASELETIDLRDARATLALLA